MSVKNYGIQNPAQIPPTHFKPHTTPTTPEYVGWCKLEMGRLQN